MITYTEDRKSHNITINNLLGEGTYGKIYLTSDNKCLKVFKESISRKDKDYFDEDVFNIIRQLKLKNFYKLYDLYYNKTLTKILGYLSEYYQKEDIDILTMPVDYTLNNLCNLYDSFLLLSKYNICISDVSMENTIINTREIRVIDTDLYYKDNKSSTIELLKNNIYTLGDLFICIYISSLKETDINKRIKMIEKIQRLFTINSTFGVEPVIKKLIKYKYPIDYLRKR